MISSLVTVEEQPSGGWKMARRRQEEKEGPGVPAQDSGLGVGGRRMHVALRKHEYFLDLCICSEAFNQRGISGGERNFRSSRENIEPGVLHP